MMNTVSFEHLLPRVEKASRYIDNEINAVHKDPVSAEVKICFAFPDLYELGISHLGLKILYSIINRLDWAMADRVYLPWLDMLGLMKEEQVTLWGLESRIAVKDFDLVGITLQSELNYTNILELLSLSGLPILSSERSNDHPIVMAGGPCATNPMPLAQFIDVFFIGEAEEAIVQIAEILRNTVDKEERLYQLSCMESCYVPVIHDKMRHLDAGFTITARKYEAFHEAKSLHRPQILSWQLATHNRYVAEIMRGCSRGCRFCHAGYYYRPVRERNADEILDELIHETRTSGWDEAGLISLSSSDYSCIKPLLINLINALDLNQTHISLPSLRVDSLDDELVLSLKKLGREGLTIAPEAGSQRLRDVINKNLSEEEILHGVDVALKLGWQKIKLYFMIGLPEETDDDIEGIISLINKINAMSPKKLQINVTLSPFVPKPFTPFQWEGFAPATQTLERILKVKQSFGNKRNIKIKYHNIESSMLEAILSRGDEKVASLVKKAWELGAIYDGWNESFDYGIWKQAAEQLEMDVQIYLQNRALAETLPWDFIDTKICKSFLISEYNKAKSGALTEDCRDICSFCGVCDETCSNVQAPIPKQVIETVDRRESVTEIHPITQYHYRVFYQKTGLLRYIAHLDWMRMLFRWIGTTSLETVFTQGFNPHPKVSLSPPLPIGVIGNEEYFDISYKVHYTPAVIQERFAEIKLPDFVILRVEEIGRRKDAHQPDKEIIVIELNPEYLQTTTEAISSFLAKESYPFTKTTETRSKSYDLATIIDDIKIQGSMITIVKKLASPSLYSVLEEILKLNKIDLYGMLIKRTGFLWD